MTTDRAFSLIVSDRWLAGVFRTRCCRRSSPSRCASTGCASSRSAPSRRSASATQRAHCRRRWRASRAAPPAGDRFPWLKLRFSPNGPTEDLFSRLDDTRFNLIVIGQRLPAADQSGSVLVHVVPDDPDNDRELARARIPKPSFYLLRPDGHVGLAGTRLEAGALKRFMTERLAAIDFRPAGV